MREFKIKGKKRFCFLVKEGTDNFIVISIESLAPIDYQRLKAVDEKSKSSGVEMMRVMRDEILDNGMNCLVQYQDLLAVVPKTKVAEVKAAKEEADKPILLSPRGAEEHQEKRGRGRPKGSKNKNQSKE